MWDRHRLYHIVTILPSTNDSEEVLTMPAGVTKKGRLKKGYRYVKGGRVVKAKAKPKPKRKSRKR